MEKLGGNDPCPCGSGRRFPPLLPFQRPLRRHTRPLLRPRPRPLTPGPARGRLRERVPHDRALPCAGPVPLTPPCCWCRRCGESVGDSQPSPIRVPIWRPARPPTRLGACREAGAVSAPLYAPIYKERHDACAPGALHRADRSGDPSRASAG
ncbi:SEC-C metal-binding domain-containing protein [Nonomuraea sp. KM90]|uniref:SEC-C metal-binding domain-containing protein n=1 Tax=Nonomuraea sp. KM90 TaxID=3457428 RepID=UPI003FCCF35A